MEETVAEPVGGSWSASEGDGGGAAGVQWGCQSDYWNSMKIIWKELIAGLELAKYVLVDYTDGIKTPKKLNKRFSRKLFDNIES